MKRDRLDTIALLLSIAGLATLLVEIRFMHRNYLQFESKTWIPLFVCLAGMIACGLALVARRWAATVAAAALMVLSLVGPLGLWFHTRGDISHLMRVVTYQVGSARQQGDDGPPALAPLGISGILVIGGLIALRIRRSYDQSAGWIAKSPDHPAA